MLLPNHLGGYLDIVPESHSLFIKQSQYCTKFDERFLTIFFTESRFSCFKRARSQATRFSPALLGGRISALEFHCVG